ncbi:MAG: protein phosphatase, partial [bacterium]
MAQQGNIQLRIFGISDTGVVRAHNQDSFIVADLSTGAVLADFSARRFMSGEKQIIHQTLGNEGSLFAVADGMGGAAAGDIASYLCLDTLVTEFNRAISNGRRAHFSVTDLLKICVEKANLRLWEESQMNIDYRGMGTTLTTALVLGDTIYLGQVGDSRAYLMRGKQFEQITKDQSAVQMLIDLGRLTKEQAAVAPNRNIILQALGVEPSIQVAMTKISLRDRDCILLCSDGLSNKINDEEMRDILLLEDLDNACRDMIKLANLRGGEDNITVLTARFEGEGLERPIEDEPIWRTVEILSIFFLEKEDAVCKLVNYRVLKPLSQKRKKTPNNHFHLSIIKLPTQRAKHKKKFSRQAKTPSPKVAPFLTGNSIEPIEPTTVTWGWQILDALKEAAKKSNLDNCAGLAKEAAYSFILSFFPVLVAIIALFFIWGNATQSITEILTTLNRMIPSESYKIVENYIQSMKLDSSSKLFWFSLVGSIWGASGIMSTLQTAFNKIYQIQSKRSFWKQQLMAIFLVFVTGVPLIISTIVTVFGEQLEKLLVQSYGLDFLWQYVWSWVRWVIVLLTVFSMAILLYRVGTEKKQKWRTVAPGAML